MNYLILIDEFLSLRKRQCKASRVETNLDMNVIKLSLLLMAVSTLSHAYQKAFEPTAANTIEIKEIDEKYLLIAQQDKNYFKSNNALFRNLFRFISEYDIPMTTPVKAEINPGKMGFYISEADYIRSLDKQSKIKPTREAAYTVISIGKRGKYSENGFKDALTELKSYLKNEIKWEASGPAYAIFWNGPYVPNFIKRFEVHIPIKPKT